MNSIEFQGTSVQSKRILYTPSTFARSNLIHLQEVGILKALEPHTSRRDNLTSYLFFIVLSGSGDLVYENRSYKLNPGDCVFIDCKKSYAHTTSNDLWALKWAHFYGPNLNSIYEKYKERGGQVFFHPEYTDSYISLLDQLISVAESEDYIKDMVIFESLTSLLTLIMKESWHPELINPPSVKRQNLQGLKEYLDKNFRHKINLDDLAKSFFINKFYLTRIFKEQFGMSINNYIIQKRITYAKHLLRFTDKNIEEIAIEVGVNDANYFSRMFKKIEEISPGEYRRMW